MPPLLAVAGSLDEACETDALTFEHADTIITDISANTAPRRSMGDLLPWNDEPRSTLQLQSVRHGQERARLGARRGGALGKGRDLEGAFERSNGFSAFLLG